VIFAGQLKYLLHELVSHILSCIIDCEIVSRPILAIILSLRPTSDNSINFVLIVTCCVLTSYKDVVDVLCRDDNYHSYRRLIFSVIAISFFQLFPAVQFN